MKVLVTGATGFLGSALCARLIADGHQVTAFSRQSSRKSLLDHLPINFAFGCISDREAVNNAVAGSEIVIHAAAHLTCWGFEKAIHQKVNVEGTRNVLAACVNNRVRRLVHVSTVAAIGIPEDKSKPANEQFEFNLRNEELSYNHSKREAELLVLEASRKDVDAVIVNPSSIFGPYGKSFRGAEMIEKVRSTRIVPYFTGGLCAVHVSDVVDGIVRVIEKGETGNRYILGGENLTYESLARRSAAALNLKRSFIPIVPAVTMVAATLMEPLGRFRKKKPKITFAGHYCAGRFHFYDSTKAVGKLGFVARDFNSILNESINFKRG